MPKSEVRNPKPEARNPKGALTLRNPQRTRKVDTGLMRWIARTLLQELLPLEDFDLGVYLVGASEMTRLNETFLRHRGSTDVIAFDYREAGQPAKVERKAPALRGRTTNRSDRRPLRRSASARCSESAAGPLCGEIFICVDDALAQARRFRTTWQSELVRYLVHGVLHLCGYDDQSPPARRKMKREEARLLRQLANRFPLRSLGPDRG